MPFGLCNAPSTFQRKMAHILRTAITAGYVVQFIDDICIHSKTLDDHFTHVSHVLDLLSLNHLRTKLSKCTFFQQQVDFLGHIISGDGIAVDPAKTDSIEKWPDPAEAHAIRSFLGFPLLSKTAPWVWGAAQQAVFDTLKDALTHAPLLAAYIDPSTQPTTPLCRFRTVLVTDASNFALGGVLMQGVGNDLRPLAYYSQFFSKAEVNYTTREQELLAIKACLSTWRHYVQGIELEVHTDHDSLRFINSQNNLTGRIARWFEYFQEFNITQIKHIKGTDNVVADV